ncbi:hypothetical protein UFOVP326_33 [uncultured Caudovirales phage]|uniref:Uncharacterized protein n=1 Tax=uncultured Caudovirales phage TaxID=2100421 RepID=A0A6J5LTJ0_9CAUD|nr:hypothetical protein UFOVP326_33 [uncultured Caudovirales phage]
MTKPTKTPKPTEKQAAFLLAALEHPDEVFRGEMSRRMNSGGALPSLTAREADSMVLNKWLAPTPRKDSRGGTEPFLTPAGNRIGWAYHITKDGVRAIGRVPEHETAMKRLWGAYEQRLRRKRELDAKEAEEASRRELENARAAVIAKHAPSMRAVLERIEKADFNCMPRQLFTAAREAVRHVLAPMNAELDALAVGGFNTKLDALAGQAKPEGGAS